VLVGLLAAVASPAQQAGVELLSQEISATSAVDVAEGGASSANAAGVPRASYVLGAGDVVTVWAAELAETANRSMQIDGQGYLNLPLVGRIQAAGLRVDELERDLNERFKVYILDPNVAVGIQEYRSQPVTVVGSVTRAGVHQLQGEKTLLEVISMAEGLRQDAGFSAKITRRLEYGEIPLPGAQVDSTERFSVAHVDLEQLFEGTVPENNIVIMPNDVVSIPRAHMVYVVGAVLRAGGFALAEQSNISTLQALALAGGMNPVASPGNARILRQGEDDQHRVEITVNLKEIMQGKRPDVVLGGDDILFIPESGVRRVGNIVSQAMISAASSIAVWRIGRNNNY